MMWIGAAWQAGDLPDAERIPSPQGVERIKIKRDARQKPGRAWNHSLSVVTQERRFNSQIKAKVSALNNKRFS